MDSGFVRKCISADDGFVGLDALPGQRGEQLADG